MHRQPVILQGIRQYYLRSFAPLFFPPFSPLSTSLEFMLATIMAPYLNATQHLLIKTLLIRGIETKLIALEASFGVRAIYTLG
jgi:hypothetical protein